MTDTRELLELAAKACGYDFIWVEGEPHIWGGLNNNYQFQWNPITNPGDCADMEEKLSINVGWKEHSVWATTSAPIVKSGRYSDHPNRQAARMMASTRCAAEVARRMK